MSSAARSMIDAVLLRPRERLAAATPPPVRGPLLELHRTASDRARAAGRLVDTQPESALVLYREAALVFAAAAITARGGASVPAGAGPAELAGHFRDLHLPETSSTDRARAEAFLEACAVAATWSEPATARAETARSVVSWLASLVEPRTVNEVRFLRRARVSALALAALALLAVPAALLVSPKNVALHKPVTLSANHPQSVSPPSGLTDGVTSGSYGAETTTSDDPWVQVDLEHRYAIDKVKIYNRGDTAFDAGMPMRLQCSEDGHRFVEIETRVASFSQSDPWVARLRGRVCRYVRVHGARGTYVALSELEVFGRRK
jgi:hypothetical protein